MDTGPDLDTGTYLDTRAEGYADSNLCTDSNEYSYLIANIHALPNGNNLPNAHGADYQNAHSHGTSNRYANVNTRTHTYSDPYSASDRCAKPYGHTTSDCYADTDAYSDCCAKGRFQSRNLRRRRGNCARHLCGYGRTRCAGFLLLGQAKGCVRLI